jgi:TRAP transporter 4TM/12TM fusion protein
LHWTCLAGLTFLIIPLKKTNKKKYHEYISWILFIISISTGIYMLISWQGIVMSGGYYSQLDAIISFIMVLIILEATRRTVSPFLAFIAGIFILYALFGHLLPGMFTHRKYGFERVFAFLATTPEAIFGIPIGVSATYVIMFIIFGSLLQALGGSEFFMDLAFSLTGRFYGGPAKASILASALVGTISGSSTANVVTTGTFTIPLMKRSGYDKNFAGAVEAVASTGGQITPPVMGAAAFIIAEMTNTPYLKVAKAAIIPAFLYFFACFVAVHLEAKRINIALPDKESLPKFYSVMKKRGYLIIPFFSLFGFMIYGFSAMRSVFFSLIITIALSFIKKETRPNLYTIPKALIDSAKSAIPIACACACAGIIMGIINLTGIGVKLSSLIVLLAEKNLLLSLFAVSVSAIILGCGMPTTAVYIILSVLTAPALIKVGVPALTAHMFIFYYGCTAPITPPVAMSSYAAAAIAQGDPMKVAFKSVKIGFIVFVVPFLLVYFPELMLLGEPFKVLIAFLSAITGIVFLNGGTIGYLVAHLNKMTRMLLIIAGALMFIPGWKTDFSGLVLGIIIIVIIYTYKRKNAAIAKKGMI